MDVNEFHSAGGFCFKRMDDDGTVRIRLLRWKQAPEVGHEVIKEITLPENEWASVVAHVGAKGEDGDTWWAARDLHAGRIVPDEFGPQPA